jgi:hypothetical protein
MTQRPLLELRRVSKAFGGLAMIQKLVRSELTTAIALLGCRSSQTSMPHSSVVPGARVDEIATLAA